jgi:hypothetical protein
MGLLNAQMHFEMTFAKTCKMLYGGYKQYYEKRIAVVLCDPHHKFSYAENIKVFQLYGWLHLEFVSILDSQSSNCPVNPFYLKDEPKVPKESDYVCVSSPIILSLLSRDKSVDFDDF